MTDRLTGGGISSKDLSKKAEREQRILDAAEELLQKWGYRKTTLADIAKKARVAKGTIYLSWKTREEIFMALIERTKALILSEIIRQMAQDPESMTLPGMIKHSLLVSLKHPLMKALVLQDTEFLGELITHEYSKATYQAQMQGYMAILDFLRNHGLIRNDVDLHEQAISVISVSWGFLLIDPFLPDDFKVSDQRKVEIITTTLKRLLEPDIPPTNEQRREGQQVFKQYMEQSIALSKQQENEAATKS